MPRSPARPRPAPSRAKPARTDSRAPQVLDAAAAQFAAKGFKAASIRSIVADVGMLPGSLYCHFANKDELLTAVYAEGVRRIGAAVDAAVQAHSEPWARLEAACAAHMAALLDHSAYAKVVISVSPDTLPALAPQLVALRDGHEQRFVELIAALPLPPRLPRRTLRLMLLGALNWSPHWYRSGGQTPARLARDFIHLLKSPLLQPAP